MVNRLRLTSRAQRQSEITWANRNQRIYMACHVEHVKARLRDPGASFVKAFPATRRIGETSGCHAVHAFRGSPYSCEPWVREFQSQSG
jgi:hypothetical protein